MGLQGLTECFVCVKFLSTFCSDQKGSVIFYQEGEAPENLGGGGSGTLSKIKRGDQKIFSN